MQYTVVTNSARTIRWTWRYEPETVILNYNHEILPDQRVTLRRVMKDEQFRLTGYVNDAIAFDIGGSLRGRQL